MGIEAELIGFQENLFPLLRVEPGFEMGIGIETEDGYPVVLDTRNGRLELVALKSLESGLYRRDPPVPAHKCFLPTRFDPCRDDYRYGGGTAWCVLSKEMDVALTTQKWLKLVKQMQPLLGLEPRTRCFDGLEALDDYPVSLHRRRWRNDSVIDIAGECSDDIVHPLLPLHKLIRTIGYDAVVSNKRDC